MPYKENGAEYYNPGEQLPARADHGPVGRPAQEGDFNWLQPGPISRFKGRGLKKAVQGQVAILEAVTHYHTQGAATERARQDRALAYHEAELLPAKVELQRQRLHGALLEEHLRKEAVIKEHERAAKLSKAE